MDFDYKSIYFRSQIKKLYSELKIDIPTNSFGCAHLSSCLNSINSDRNLHKGNWAYVGVEYGNAKIQGRQVRILFIAMDRGGKNRKDEETFAETQCSFRSSTECPKNAHMGGVSLIMKELVDDKEPTVYSHQFALTNADKCSKPSKHRKYEANEKMRQNCVDHLDREIKVLRPDLIITQGSDPTKTVKRLLKLANPTDTFKHSDGRGKCDI